jgi:peptidylprolyl isomerase domain and WD repeat-containing protein 1
MEHNERFLHISLYQGIPKKNHSITSHRTKEELDPTIICTAYKRNRFYLFSRREPEDHQAKKQTSRDILNEQPTQTEIQLAHTTTKALPTQVQY